MFPNLIGMIFGKKKEKEVKEKKVKKIRSWVKIFESSKVEQVVETSFDVVVKRVTTPSLDEITIATKKHLELITFNPYEARSKIELSKEGAKEVANALLQVAYSEPLLPNKGETKVIGDKPKGDD